MTTTKFDDAFIKLQHVVKKSSMKHRNIF